ncbi:MAG: 16S rRNA (cytidine(1402)-2'-O)-methyltransferase [Kiritimatiellia bacterium]
MLYVIATPIGNLGDMTFRAVDVLKQADVVACEDTRRTRALLSYFEINRPGVMLSCREGVEARAAAKVLEYLRSGRNVALCSDAGYPGISDPGYRLVSAATAEGIDPVVIPGASAVPAALIASGLPSSSYTFKGYPPRKKGPAFRFFKEEANTKHTLVVFESPMRVAKTLKTALEALGDRRAAVCAELTKKFEKTTRDYLSELAGAFEGRKVKGEVTLVIAGSHPKFTR